MKRVNFANLTEIVSEDFENMGVYFEDAYSLMTDKVFDISTGVVFGLDISQTGSGSIEISSGAIYMDEKIGEHEGTSGFTINLPASGTRTDTIYAYYEDVYDNLVSGWVKVDVTTETEEVANRYARVFGAAKLTYAEDTAYNEIPSGIAVVELTVTSGGIQTITDRRTNIIIRGISGANLSFDGDNDETIYERVNNLKDPVVKQCVLKGKTSSGLPAFLSNTSDAVGIDSDSDNPLVVNFANGPDSSYTETVDAASGSVWSNLPESDTIYLYVDRDNGNLSFSYKLQAPVYDYEAPAIGSPPVSFTDNCNTFTSWTTTGEGTATSDGVGIYPSSFGSNNGGWHGPTIIKDFGEDFVGDFTFDSQIQMSNSYSSLHKLLIELLDSSDNVLCKLDAQDSFAASYTSNVRTYEGTSNQFYSSGDTTEWNGYTGTVRFTRVDSTWSFYKDGVLKGSYAGGNTTTVRKVRISFQQYQTYAASTMKVDNLYIEGADVGLPTSENCWFDINEYKMKEYNGASWAPVQRVFLGEVMTGASGSVSSGNVVPYAFKGEYTPGRISASASTATTKNHNIGTDMVTAQVFEATTTDGSLRNVAITGLTSKTVSVTTGSGVVEIQPIVKRAF